jgi:hypothetical protein
VYLQYVRLRHLALGLLVAICAVVAAPGASAKNGVKATLTTMVPLDAPAGTRVTVAWRLGYVDENGRRHPFDAGGVFARIVAPSGAPAVKAYASGARGEYRATVAVPKGGIGDIEIGLVSWTSGASGTRQVDSPFPITNDPIPDGPRILSPPEGAVSEPDGGMSPWIFVVAGGLLLAVLAAGLWRRRPLARFG